MELGTNFITSMKEWNPVGDLSPEKNTAGAAAGSPIFKDVLENVVGQVYSTQQDLEKKQYLLAAGQLDDAHTLPIAEAKASMSIELLISLRNKAMESYSELMKMSV